MSVIETSTAPLAQQQANALLNVKDLRVTFATPDGDVTAVNDLNFSLRWRNAGYCWGIRFREIANGLCPDGPAGSKWPYRRFCNFQRT